MEDSLLVRVPLILAFPWEVVLVFPADVERDEQPVRRIRVRQNPPFVMRRVQWVGKASSDDRVIQEDRGGEDRAVKRVLAGRESGETYEEHWSLHPRGTFAALSSVCEAVVAEVIVVGVVVDFTSGRRLVRGRAKATRDRFGIPGPTRAQNLIDNSTSVPYDIVACQ